MNNLSIVIYFALIGYLNLFMTLNEFDPEIKAAPLYDYGHNLLPFISNSWPNAFVIIYVIYFVLRFVRKNSLSNVMNTMYVMAIIFTIRLFCFTLTIEPPLLPKCDYRHHGEPIRWNVLKYLFAENDNTCLDYMFSGHAAYFTIITLYVFRFSPYLLEKMLSIIWCVLGYVLIIAARIHYTADVVVGIAITVLTFKLYFKKNDVKKIIITK